MHSKTLIGFIVLSWFCSILSIPSEGREDKEREFHKVRIKTFVQELGTGESSSVRVSLKNHKVIYGYIKESFDEYFILTGSPEIRNDLRINYSEVHKIEKYSLRNEKRVKRALKIAAVVAAAVTAVGLLLYSSSD